VIMAGLVTMRVHPYFAYKDVTLTKCVGSTGVSSSRVQADMKSANAMIATGMRMDEGANEGSVDFLVNVDSVGAAVR